MLYSHRSIPHRCSLIRTDAGINLPKPMSQLAQESENKRRPSRAKNLPPGLKVDVVKPPMRMGMGVVKAEASEPTEADVIDDVPLATRFTKQQVWPKMRQFECN